MTILLETHDARGVATLTLNRPDKYNALNPPLIEALNAALARAAADPAVRVVVIAGAGEMFCAGADVGYLKEAGAQVAADNKAGSRVYSRTTELIRGMGKPVIARVQRGAYGGGVTLVAACDIVVADDAVRFAITETKFGLTPSIMLPYLIGRIGQRQARRWCLTAERMGAAEAARIGLVDILAPAAELDTAVAKLADALLMNAPGSIAVTKDWMNRLARPAADEATVARTVEAFAEGRASDEAKEGTRAFLEKRKPAWAVR